MNKKELMVAGLENGTVLDHIPSDRLFKVVEKLQLDQAEEPVTIGNNLESSKLGRKGIIKMANRFLNQEEIERIALIIPNAKVSRIENYEVVNKGVIELPDEVYDIVKCGNPKCISNNEPMRSRFSVTNKKEVVIKCHFCEKEFQKDDIIFK